MLVFFKMSNMVENTSEVKDGRNQWDDVSCPVCMDHPHNAVLIICSSHDKGCRSYICDTSYRHSNCLDRFKKLIPNNAGTIQTPSSSMSVNLVEYNNEDVNGNMKCPLCRGTVLGWMVVKEAREYLDLKPRSCSHESCLFSGTYKELRRHARRVHITTRPADVNPTRQRAWDRLEDQSAYGDVISAIRSEMPGALVVGDYVIDTVDSDVNAPGEARGRWWASTLFLFNAFDGLHRPAERRNPYRNWRMSRRLYMDENRAIVRRRRRSRFFRRSGRDEERQ